MARIHKLVVALLLSAVGELVLPGYPEITNAHEIMTIEGNGRWAKIELTRTSLNLVRLLPLMHHGRSFLAVLFLLGSPGAATPAIAAEDTSPPAVTSHEVNVVRQVAIALAAGSDAVQDLRGDPIENSNLDRLKLPTPGMDCGIDRSLMYVACHSASLHKKEVEAMFARIIDDVQTALPADSWRAVEAAPPAGLIRSSSYQHRKSGARIDVDLVARPGGDTEPRYWVRVFGWKRF